MGKMSQFRRALRSCAGQQMALQANDGFGATLMLMLERIIRADGVLDRDIIAAFREMPEGLFEHAGPRIVAGGKGGKATAIISLRGIALYDFEFQPFAFSTLLLSQTVKAMANDPEIGTIVLDIDSPGGMVTGTPEAADAIFAARSTGTNIIALVSPLAASAAFWLASQANEIISVPSGDVGSIGVFMLHFDQSGMLEQFGIKPTFIFAGEFKVEGNSFEPLGEEAEAHFQSEVDATHKDFIKAVARGRDVSISTVANNFGRGRTVSAQDAKKAGMINRIATRDVALARAGVNGQNLEGRRRVEDGAEELVAGIHVTDMTAVEVNDMASKPRPLVFGRMTNLDDGLIQVNDDGEQAEPENLVFRTEGHGDDQKVYAVSRWPEKVRVSAGIFDEYCGFRIVRDGDMVTITVDNGCCKYKVVSGYGLFDVCHLVESTWEEPPEAPADPDAEEQPRQAAHRRRLAGLSRRLAVLRH